MFVMLGPRKTKLRFCFAHYFYCKQQLTKQPTEKPTEKPSEKPTEKTLEVKPIEKPSEKPTEKILEKASVKSLRNELKAMSKPAPKSVGELDEVQIIEAQQEKLKMRQAEL